jgi:HAD superfamily hydrolase (TIGR01509 family)
VLLWDAALHVRAWNAVAKELRGREMSDDEASLHMLGRPNAYIASYLAGRTVTGQQLRELSERKESLYRRLCLEDPESFVLSPGAAELLQALKERAVPRTIATSSEQTNLDFFVTHLGLARWFDTTQIVYDDGRRPGKPAPDVYLEAAHNIGVPPAECVVVEDAIAGVEAARAAGIGYIIGIGPSDVCATLEACDGVAATIASLAGFPRELLRGK